VAEVDVVIRSGTVYDGSGGEPVVADIAVTGNKIVEIGQVSSRSRQEIDAGGLAVAPGFINMMCWANEHLLHDGRSQSDIRQGVTLEILGEGWSMGPVNDRLRAYLTERQRGIRYDISWATLDQYLEHLVKKGVSCNVASFIGAGGVRAHVLGFDDRRPTATELAEMQALVARAMADGAVGVSSALIYSPDSFASTEELIALAKVAAAYDGIYISHLRSEGGQFLEALEEFLTIVKQSGVRGEVYHLKAAGQKYWPKLDAAIARIDQARAEGLAVTADMYTYAASSSGLDWLTPAWSQEGGHKAWVQRLRDPATRRRIMAEMAYEGDEWENPYLEVGSPENVLFTSFRNEALRSNIGKTLAQVAAERNKSAIETVLDLIVEDNSRVGAVFFSMSEENVRKKVALPWVSFCSDSGSMAPEGLFLNFKPHPRAYGSFARLLGKYVREERIISLPEAVRRLAALPAEVLRLDRRGRLLPGYYADIAIFDPNTIQDHATFADPHQYATGMVHVFVNGSQVLADGHHTGALPGRVVRGSGWTGRRPAEQ
jgi:N-acyl-D-amino-acid deacylase